MALLQEELVAELQNSNIVFGSVKEKLNTNIV